jgi:8-oxo-dGTP pyrophosphatase MutT (NUDIX family)
MHNGTITTGKFYPNTIKALYKPRRINQTLDAIKFIESKWSDFVNNQSIAFNGRLFRVDRYIIENNRIEIHLSDTDYKEFVGTRDHDFIGRFGRENAANPLSVGAVIVTKDNKIVLGKRAEDIDIGKSKISVAAGYLDPEKDMVNSANSDNTLDIFSGIKREIYEETGITNRDIVDLVCMGLINNKEKNQINAPFYCKLDISAKEFETNKRPQQAEFSQIIMVDNTVRSIDDFINRPENELSDVLVPTLSMYKSLIRYIGDPINY